MEDTQSFRLIETMDTVEITLHHVDGQNIVYWEDIEQVFPGVKRVRNGNSVIKFLRGFDQQSVNCRPQSALDVVLSTSIESVSVSPSKFDPTDRQTDVTGALANAAIEDNIVTALDVARRAPETAVASTDTSSSPLYNVDASSKATLFQQVVTRASRKARESEIEQRFISLLAPEVQETVRASSDIYQAFTKAIKDGNGGLSQADLRHELKPFQMIAAKNTELLEEMSAMRKEVNAMRKEGNAKQEEADRLQQKVLDNQKVMEAKQNKVEELQKQILDNQDVMKQLQIQALGQLAVLQSRVQAVLTQTYELHEYPIPRLFVVLPQDPSGWDAKNPFSNKFRLFFLCECGEHTKSIDSKTEIHFAKHEGYDIARPTEFFQQYGPYVLTILKMLKFGVSVAGVAVPAISHLVRAEFIDEAATYLQLLKDFEPMMNPVIDWMDKVSTNEGEAVDEFTKQMQNKEALAGADLRKLDTFLKAKDGDKVLGNLYRTVTDEGHVKWVCIDHYRENYQESTAKDFQRMLDSVGGSFDKSIGRVAVALRSRVLAEQFFSALGKARSVYELDIDLDWACTTSDLEALEDALMKSRVSILRLDLQQFRSSAVSKVLTTSTQYDFLFRIRDLPNMKVLHIVVARELIKFLGFPPKKSTHVCKMSCELASGRIGGKEIRILAEALKINSTLTTLDLGSNSIGSEGAKALADALKTNSALTTLNLSFNSIGDDGAKALADALKTNSTVTISGYGK